jgi:hypothetical protein
MKRGFLLSTGLLALALMTSACSESSNPVSTGASNLTVNAVESEDPGVLSNLQDPRVLADYQAARRYRLLFTAGASGTSDAPSVRAARSISTIEFEVRDPGGALIGETMASEVVTTGVQRDDGASLTVFGDAEWNSSVVLAPGTTVTAIVRGIHGETLIVREEVLVAGDE